VRFYQQTGSNESGFFRMSSGNLLRTRPRVVLPSEEVLSFHCTTSKKSLSSFQLSTGLHLGGPGGVEPPTLRLQSARVGTFSLAPAAFRFFFSSLSLDLTSDFCCQLGRGFDSLTAHQPSKCTTSTFSGANPPGNSTKVPLKTCRGGRKSTKTSDHSLTGDDLRNRLVFKLQASAVHPIPHVVLVEQAD
jgi:hypothetical protein